MNIKKIKINDAVFVVSLITIVIMIYLDGFTTVRLAGAFNVAISYREWNTFYIGLFCVAVVGLFITGLSLFDRISDKKKLKKLLKNKPA